MSIRNWWRWLDDETKIDIVCLTQGYLGIAVLTTLVFFSVGGYI